jgi:hypothetical protein
MEKKKEMGFHYCAMPQMPPRTFAMRLSLDRLAFVTDHEKKWINGTVLKYWFFDKPKGWTTTEKEKDIVRAAFKVWMDVGIGIEFKEVDSISDSDIRISFVRDNRTWSGLGRDIRDFFGKNENTMNFGWDLINDDSRGIDTAVHEIGHTLAAPHEHQNPFSGIVWNEKAVLDDLSGPPNNWDPEMIKHNILNKLDKNVVMGSDWDPNSIMHYPFKAGLILVPEKYKTAPLIPAGGLSARDKEWIKKTYPPLSPADYVKLELMKSYKLSIGPGEDKTFVFEPKYSRVYNLGTFGNSDTLITLNEDQGAAEPRYMQGDDDSGTDLNAKITTKLEKGHKYLLRLKLYWQDRSGETAVMVW